MNKKKFGWLAVGVAAVLSMSIGFAACTQDNEEDPEPGPGPDTPSTSASVIKDEALADKFVAMFTFDDSAYDEMNAYVKVPAHDPYTGDANEELYATYVSADGAVLPGATQHNGTPSLDAGAILRLKSINPAADPFFPGEYEVGTNPDGTPSYSITDAEAAGGMSFSFWYYRPEATANDWNSMIKSETTKASIINWGNISYDGGSAYPSLGAVHGRAAYTDTSYAAAQEELALGQMRSSNAYTVYNAMCPEAAGTEDYVGEMGDALTATWMYMTVVMTDKEISFYRDGVLAYSYQNIAGVTAIWESIYLDVLLPLDGVQMFGNASDVVDDVLIGKELTAEEVRALYEDVSGTELSDEDVNLSSSVVTTVQQAMNTYGGCQWYDTAVSWAQAELPTGDLNFTWTGKLYTDASQAWYGPTFILFEKIEGEGVGVQNTPPAGGVSMVYIRSDNYSGMCANLSDADRADGFEPATTDVNLKTIEFTTESTPEAFRYTLADKASYTKTDEADGLTTELYEVTPVSLVVNVVRTGNTWTVTYYKDAAEEANVIWAFTFQYSATTPLIFNIGGEGVYLTDLTITNNVAGGAALTLNKTTVGTATPVDLEGFTEVA